MPASALTGIQPIYRTGDVVGGDPRAYDPAYGGIPTLPKYVTDTQQTIGPDIYTQLTANLPGYTDMVGLSGENIMANLRGEISQPVMGQLATAAAERGVGGGFGPGSPNEQAAYLANVLRMSQGLQALGENQLTAAIQRTPIQQTQLGTQTKSLEEEIAQYAAAPEPAAAAREELANAMAGIGAGGGSVRMPALTQRTGGAQQPVYNAWDRPDYIQRAYSGAGADLTPYDAPMKGGFYDLPMGATIGESGAGKVGPYGTWDPMSPTYGQVVETDESGDQWVDIGGGQQMNLTTGQFYDADVDEFYNWE